MKLSSIFMILIRNAISKYIFSHKRSAFKTSSQIHDNIPIFCILSRATSVTECHRKLKVVNVRANYNCNMVSNLISQQL